jgi:hypothetical protein
LQNIRLIFILGQNIIHPKPKNMSKFNELKELVMGLEADFHKFYDKNNSAAGTRVRKGMLELKNLAQDIRKEVQDKKKA